MVMVWIVRAVMMTSMMARLGRRFLCSYYTRIVHHFDGKLFNYILEETRVIQSRFLAFIRIYWQTADTQKFPMIFKTLRAIYIYKKCCSVSDPTKPNKTKIYLFNFIHVYVLDWALHNKRFKVYYYNYFNTLCIWELYVVGTLYLSYANVRRYIRCRKSVLLNGNCKNYNIIEKQICIHIYVWHSLMCTLTVIHLIYIWITYGDL